MATVYLAIQESFQREVALKVMSSSLAEDADFSERFLREARIVSRLVHPNIVTVYDVGIHDGHHYLSMEYIPGTDLKHNFLELDGVRILRLMKELAAALDYAGKKGYVHRDVKPENIMISQEDGRAVLMDFGIARVADTDNNMTKTGVALGTPYYMSPEQARGKAVDGRSDLYALGVVFYLIVMGKVPYDAESAIAIGIKHISDPIPTLPVALVSLQPLINKLMAKNPEHRFQTGSEFIVALKNIQPGVIDSWKAIGGMESNVVRHDTPVRTSRKKTERRVPVQTSIRSSEALHIPKEDIVDRRKTIEPVEKKSSSVLWLVFLLSGILFGGYYFLFGLRFPPPPQDVNNFAKTLGLPPVYTSMPVAKKEPLKDQQLAAEVLSSPGQTDNLEAVAEPEKTEPLDESNPDPELRDLINQSRVMAASVVLQPELTGQLVSLYQKILDKQGDQEEALAGIARIKEKQEIRFEEQLKNKNYPQAEASLASLLSWFPELIEDEQFRELEKRLSVSRRVDELLLIAKKYMDEKKLRQPAGENAVEEFNKVLALSPNNQQAKEGLKLIAKTYYSWAKSAQSKEDFDKALLYVNSGLQVSKENDELQALYKQLTQQVKKKKEIASLLADAINFEQQGILFGKEGSASQRYLAVLAIQPDNDLAIKAIQKLQQNAVNKVEQLAQHYEFDQAISQLQQVLEVFPNNEKLGELLLDIELRKPFITQLFLSGEPVGEVDLDAGDVISETVNVNRTLYVAFKYQNFDQPTTVMQARLYDGARAVQIAAVPVVVSGKKGTARFKIDRPVEAFTEGGYHIDILMNGKLIKTQSFSVVR